MRALPLICLTTLLLAGCADGLGLGMGCTAEMNAARRREGRPPDRVQQNQRAGDHTEIWYYFSGTQTRTYTFRWGVSYGSCEVEGPAGFALLPLVG